MERRNRPIPNEVKRAILNRQHDVLSAFGKTGNEHRAILRQLKKEDGKHRTLEVELEKAQTEEVSPEGDVLPPDRDHIEALEAVLEE